MIKKLTSNQYAKHVVNVRGQDNLVEKKLNKTMKVNSQASKIIKIEKEKKSIKEC